MQFIYKERRSGDRHLIWEGGGFCGPQGQLGPGGAPDTNTQTTTRERRTTWTGDIMYIRYNVVYHLDKPYNTS